MKNIAEENLDFKSLEQEIFKIMCRIACELMRTYLEMRDMGIMAIRDTKEYRCVDKRATTVKTIMGEVAFTRHYYKKASGGYVFLLDEAMGIDCGCGLVSENLAEQIVVECTDKSFRKAAGNINCFTGQSISAMGVWGAFQKYGELVGQQAARLKELDDSGSSGHLGNIPSPVIFEEFDDVWLSMQREKRLKPGERARAPRKKIGKKPMHVGTAYTGWSRSKDGRYKTENKIAYASYVEASVFTSAFGALLRNRFDMDGVERQIMNGDGAGWIKTEAEESDAILQLDPYHRSEAAIRAVGGSKGDRRALFDAIGEKDVGKVLDTICGLLMAAKDEPAFKRLAKLYGYYYGNRDIFLTWQERGIELPAPPEGITYRELGTQESSNCSLITGRMKNRKGSWSVEGANHMAQILCFRHTIGLDVIMGTLPEPSPTKSWADPLSAAKSPLHDGKGYGADWLYAQMPFEQAFRTQGRKVIRGMLRLKPLSSLPFLLGEGSNKTPRL